MAFLFLADVFVPEVDTGIGAAQLLGIQSGVFTFLFGTGLLIAGRQGFRAQLRTKIIFSRILELPTIFWVGISGLIVFFFLLYQAHDPKFRTANGLFQSLLT